MNELHVEAGTRLNGALLRSGLVDEMLIYIAPVMVGIGQGMAQLGPIEQLAAAHRLRFTEVVTMGGDIRLRARTVGLNAPSTQTEGRRHS